MDDYNNEMSNPVDPGTWGDVSNLEGWIMILLFIVGIAVFAWLTKNEGNWPG